jgi:hyperosmotically inducible periplasmic protein
MKAVLVALFAVCALVAAPVSMHAAGLQATPAVSTDKAIDDRVEAQIKKDASLKKYDIDVAVDNGVVTLTGTVATAGESAKATQLATAAGAKRVDNRLVLDLSAGAKGTSGTMKESAKAGAAKTKDSAEKAADKTKDSADKAGDKSKEGLSKTGEAITDGWITTRVKSKFVGEDLLKDSDINVDTNNHVVTLRGTVLSAAAKARAEAQAKEVEGVRSVVNNLTIGPKK